MCVIITDRKTEQLVRIIIKCVIFISCDIVLLLCKMNVSTKCLNIASTSWGDVGQWDNSTNTSAPNLITNYCPQVWDGLLCWPPTPPGTIAHSNCPAFKGSDITKSAFRQCTNSGEWLDRDGIESSASGWTNYTLCLTPEIREIMRRLGSDEDAKVKYKIATNTRILEFVGLSMSLAALLLSLLIFYYFRTLRNTRTRLHRHLFIAMVIQVAIRLTLYTDQAITRRSSSSVLMSKSTNNNTMMMMRGIDNTPILCEATYISLEYARTAMFMWMFVEGLFLHNMITVTVFEEKLSPLVYPMIGWIIPIPLTVTWAVVTYLYYGAGATCWWGYNFTLYFWILEGPRLAVLVVNLAFLLNILRVLIIKLRRQSNSSELQQALKAVKAALLLLPLLGLTNLLNMLEAPLEKSPLQFAIWSYSTHLLTSTQGLVLAFLYCFRNGEVQLVIKKLLTRRTSSNMFRSGKRPKRRRRRRPRHSLTIPLSTFQQEQQQLPTTQQSQSNSSSQINNHPSPSSPSSPSSSFWTKTLNQTIIAEETETANNSNNNNNVVNRPLLHPSSPSSQTHHHHHHITMMMTTSSSSSSSSPLPPPPLHSSSSNQFKTKKKEKMKRSGVVHPSSSSSSSSYSNWRFLVVFVPRKLFGIGGGGGVGENENKFDCGHDDGGDDVKVDNSLSCDDDGDDDDDDDGVDSVVVVVGEES